MCTKRQLDRSSVTNANWPDRTEQRVSDSWIQSDVTVALVGLQRERAAKRKDKRQKVTQRQRGLCKVELRWAKVAALCFIIISKAPLEFRPRGATAFTLLAATRGAMTLNYFEYITVLFSSFRHFFHPYYHIFHSALACDYLLSNDTTETGSYNFMWRLWGGKTRHPSGPRRKVVKSQPKDDVVIVRSQYDIMSVEEIKYIPWIFCISSWRGVRWMTPAQLETCLSISLTDERIFRKGSICLDDVDDTRLILLPFSAYKLLKLLLGATQMLMRPLTASQQQRLQPPVWGLT